MIDVRVLTLNVLQLPLVSFAVGGLRRIELARRLVERLDADVVVLNEAFNLSESGYLVRWLRSRGYAATPQLGSCHGANGWTSRTGRRHRGRLLASLGFRSLELRLGRTDLQLPGGTGCEWTVHGDVPDAPGLYAFTLQRRSEDGLRVVYVGMTEHLWMTKGICPEAAEPGVANVTRVLPTPARRDSGSTSK
jgi:hypothetical protein